MASPIVGGLLPAAPGSSTGRFGRGDGVTRCLDGACAGHLVGGDGLLLDDLDADVRAYTRRALAAQSRTALQLPGADAVLPKTNLAKLGLGNYR